MLAQLTALVYNAMRDPKKPAAKPKDFLPQRRKAESWADMLLRVRQMHAMIGGK